MIKKNTVFLNGRKIGTYEFVQKAGSGHINFNGFDPYEAKLTDDQQVVLEWLKEETQKTDDSPFKVTHRFFTEKLHKRLPKNIYFSYLRLNDEQQFQVLAAFANYGLEGEG